MRLKFQILLFASACCCASNAFSAEPVHHWQFSEASRDGALFIDSRGDLTVTVEGEVHVKQWGEAEALLIDRDETRVNAPYNRDVMPKDQITVEVWAAIDKTVEWGGLVSCFETLRGADSGFLLGFKQSNFHFALATEGADDGNGRMTEARALSSLEWGRWHHVVGVYDGEAQYVYVNGELEAKNEEPSGAILYPENAQFVLGAWIDSDENFRWRGWLNETAIYDTALSAEEIKARYEDKKGQFPPIVDADLGPYVKRIDTKTVAIHWKTSTPQPSVLWFGDALPLNERYEDPLPKTEHKIVISDLKREKLYWHRIELSDGRFTRLFEFDSTFDYTEPAVPILSNPYPDDEWTAKYDAFLTSALDRLDTDKGYALVIGCGDGRMAYELARRTKLRILAIDSDTANVQAARRNLDDAGLYGVRVSVSESSYDTLPYTNYFANLIVSDTLFHGEKLDADPAELFRVLRPSGGVMALGSPSLEGAESAITATDLQNWLEQGGIMDAEFDAEGGAWTHLTRGTLPGSGQWTHMYANGGNTACSMDEYPSNPMRVAWFGRPGPRPMVDRGTRPQGPLSAEGRLFVQGDRRLFAIDAYNGTILWTLEIPDLRRANVPRDSGNMVTSGDSLFVVVKDACWQLDARNGELQRVFELPESEENEPYEWGYLGCHEGMLLGSKVKKGGVYIGADGEWYDANNHESDKVVSDVMFAYNIEDGALVWTHEGAPVINPTICFGDGKMHWVESRNPEAMSSSEGRLPSAMLSDRFVMGINLQNGAPLWEQSYDFTEGRWVFYMAYAKDTLVVVSTTDQYQIYAFDASTGSPLWNHEYSWYRDHHGGAMQRPVIIEDTVYAEPRVFKLRSGEMLDLVMPERNKCGTITAGANTLFYRDYYHGMWDLEKNIRTHFVGIRPGCWLGVIPAGGLMLAPESSAGCFCAHPIQTSMAYIPVESLGRN